MFLIIKKGVVLAVNARVLVQNYKPLQQILSKYPNCQMLVWTGKCININTVIYIFNFHSHILLEYSIIINYT